jgi:thiosulfate/3-mercaptopyruvate sulfurtransferase
VKSPEHPTGLTQRLAVLVDADALAAELAGPNPPVLLDVRWALGDPHGREHHREGHVPGAVYVDLDTELAEHSADATQGRHPLPDVAGLQASARRWGISAGRPVVAYDATGGLAAARAWWLLRWAGLTDVRLLDGGLAAWTAAGRPIETGPGSDPEPGDVELTGGHLPVLDADGAAALPSAGLLLDARAAERYRGEVEPIDPRAGHIPGAVSAPTSDNLAADGRFRRADELRVRFAALGAAEEVGVYCGSGVTAAHQIAALATIGVDAALYPGSWSAWSSDPDRPVATGPEPGP